METGSIYKNGAYARANPQWHAEDSFWKASQILKIMSRNNLKPKTICEIGCGAGEILKTLQNWMDINCRLDGYEISPYAFNLCQIRANEKLQFHRADFLEEKDAHFDLILCIDLLEHLEDYYHFLRAIKSKSEYKIFHIPLEMFALGVLSRTFILGQRRKSGHLHFFTKDLAIQTLRNLGYEVMDSFYTPGFTQGAQQGLVEEVLFPLRIASFHLNQDLTVRLMGGYSLMVLAGEK